MMQDLVLGIPALIKSHCMGTIYLCSPGIATSREDHHPLYGK